MDSSNKQPEHHHHILPYKTAFAIGGALIFLTGVTVWIAGVDLGKFNFLIAMFVACIKASLVALFFMNLWYDKKENGVIFATSFLFLAIFMVFTSTDVFFRGDVYVKGPIVPMGKAKAKFKKPWIPTPELIAHGKELFAQQCVSCHGAEGLGNGAAASGLVPPPRNFHQSEGWVNGRKPSQIFKTLKVGARGAMASFAGTLPAEDRWALADFVNSLGPDPKPTDTTADLLAMGVDPTKDTAEGAGSGADETKAISVKLAMARMTEQNAEASTTISQEIPNPSHPGASIYQARCASCHGVAGQGGVRVRNLGVNPIAYANTAPLVANLEGMRSSEAFNKIVIQGIPGDLMPGNGQLSSAELRDLYEYVRSMKH